MLQLVNVETILILYVLTVNNLLVKLPFELQSNKYLKLSDNFSVVKIT